MPYVSIQIRKAIMLIKLAGSNVKYCGEQHRKSLMFARPHGTIKNFPETKSLTDLIFSEQARLPAIPHALIQHISQC